jgi:acetyl-CoA carboxylase biotin carboxyl carrier protein
LEQDLLKKLLALMDEGGLTEIEYETEDSRIRLSRQSGMVMPAMPAAAPAAAPAATPAADATPTSAAEPDDNDGLEVFTAPMVGTFYRSPSPEADPYVATGDQIEGESVLCVIEAMKVMNEIKAECSGEVVQILAEDGEAVEYGQALFKIRP